MLKNVSILFFVLILLTTGGGILNKDEEELVKEKLESFNDDLGKYAISDIIRVVGESFLGTEYVAGTLDSYDGEEHLVIKISGLDCVTFVENTLAMARVIQKGKRDVESFKKELQEIRYRGGKIKGYTSRLHYFSDWIFDNEKKGIVKDITKTIGGVPYKKKIDFMSTHPDLYKQLSADEDNLEKIVEVESNLNKRKHFYIPKSEVDSYYEKLKTGDIIATTTNVKGLDISHTGFVYKSNGKTYFLHASIESKEIIVSGKELKGYLNEHKKQTGIMVARPLETEYK